MIASKLEIPISDMPTRSLLYHFEPLGNGSEIESLTSYINRLAWTYCLGPRLFIAEAILPHLEKSFPLQLSIHRLGSFCRSEAMRINAAGENAIQWSNILERLTTRSDLKKLTLCSWASGLPPRGLLRTSPAWCSHCYNHWQEHKLPIYQPLYWMFQVIKICMKHRTWLEELCPHCQKPQSAIEATTHPGYCTQCAAWLGICLDEDYEIEEDIFTWQQWVMDTIDELRQVSATIGSPKWELCSASLAVCAQVVGGTRQLARIVGLPPTVPRHWILGESIPSFKCLLELCYVLNISPLQLILSSQEDLVTLLRTKKTNFHPLPGRLIYNQVNDERTLKLINAILDDRETPLAVRQVERLFGLGEATLVNRFPGECALLTAKYQVYRTERAKQRVERDREEVRQATIALYEQGINPSKHRLAAILSDPDLMRRPECREVWHVTKRELRLEP